MTTDASDSDVIETLFGEMFGGLIDDMFSEFFDNETPRRHPVTKAKLDSLFAQLQENQWERGLTEESYESILTSGVTSKNYGLAAVATEIALQEQPITLRGLFYRVVSASWLPSTDQKHYGRLGRLMTRLRETGVVPYSWIVDNLRSTQKPSSWSGLNEFIDTVRESYRKDFWANLPEYVHIFCEKDAIAGTIAPVTREFDVALSPIRGYVSVSYAHEIASQWSRIDKPIHAYYVGDFDPSGFDLERDIKEKLARYCDNDFTWERLGINAEDFDEFNLIPLEPKASDRRYRKFVERHGSQCAEIDALPPTELRRRIRDAIEQHIPKDEWDKLHAVEQAERETFERVLDALGDVA